MTAMVFQPRNVGLILVCLIYDSESLYGNMIFPQTNKERSVEATPL